MRQYFSGQIDECTWVRSDWCLKGCDRARARGVFILHAESAVNSLDASRALLTALVQKRTWKRWTDLITCDIYTSTRQKIFLDVFRPIAQVLNEDFCCARGCPALLLSCEFTCSTCGSLKVLWHALKFVLCVFIVFYLLGRCEIFMDLKIIP